MNKKWNKDFIRISAMIEDSWKKLLEKYRQNVIVVPGENRWDYAIPENYTNYHDGFLWQDGEPYRGMPIVLSEGKILYLHKAVRWIDLAADEDEKLLLFDREGNRYTFIVKKQIDQDKPNPSYSNFLPKVKKYVKKK